MPSGKTYQPELTGSLSGDPSPGLEPLFPAERGWQHLQAPPTNVVFFDPSLRRADEDYGQRDHRAILRRVEEGIKVAYRQAFPLSTRNVCDLKTVPLKGLYSGSAS